MDGWRHNFTKNQQDAIAASNNPSLDNPFVTGTDIGAGSGIPTLLQSATAEAEQNNNTSGFMEALKLTTVELPAGNYIVWWYGEQTRTGNQIDVETSVQLNDVTQLGENTVDIESTNEYKMFSGYAIVALDEGVHTIDIDFRKIGGSGLAKVRRCRLTIFQI